MKALLRKQVLIFLGIFLISCCGCERAEVRPETAYAGKKATSSETQQPATQQAPAEQATSTPTKAVEPAEGLTGQTEKSPPPAKPNPSDIVAKIGDYTITREQLNQQLLRANAPTRTTNIDTVEKIEPRQVLLDMLGEKAILIDALQSGALEDETIKTRLKNFENQTLSKMLMKRELQGPPNVTEAEINAKMASDPNLSRQKAKTLAQRDKYKKAADDFISRIYAKYHVKNVEENYPEAVKTYYNMLFKPKKPRKQKWVLKSQVDELDAEKKNIVLARFDGGVVTFGDWLYAICMMSPPSRPKNVNSRKEFEKILDRAIRPKVLTAEAKTRGLDKSPEYLKLLERRKEALLRYRTTKGMYAGITNPTDEEVKAYFEANKDMFRKARTMKVEQLWFKNLDEAKAARAKLDAGEDFEALKAEYDPEGKVRQLTTFPGLEGVFFEELWAHEPNDIVGPIKGFRGDTLKWRIVKLISKTPSRPRSYSDKFARFVKLVLMRKQREEARREFYKKFLDKHPYEIYEDVLKTVDPLKLPGED